jgi:hypothetical protein
VKVKYTEIYKSGLKGEIVYEWKNTKRWLLVL